jgi:hypothetical protein
MKQAFKNTKDSSNITDSELLQIGIYKLYFDNYDKVYIGSTKKSFRKRLFQHIHSLNIKRHKNKILQSYCDDNLSAVLKFEILEIVIDEALLKDREQHYLDLFKERLFNQQLFAYSGKGFVMPKGRRNGLETKCLQYSMDGDFIQQFNSLSEAGKILNIGSTHITTVCRGRLHSTGGFRFTYYKENFPLKLPPIKHKERGKSFYIGVKAIDEFGNYFNCESIHEFCKISGIDQRRISRMISSKHNDWFKPRFKKIKYKLLFDE